MPNDVDWVFYCPHPNIAVCHAFVTTENSCSGRIGNLWALAKKQEPSLAEVDKERCIFYIVRSSFLYHKQFP